MAYAVVIYFDEGSTKPILSVWEELAKKNLTLAMINSGVQPHFTLAIYDSFDCGECEKEIRRLAEHSGLLSLNVDHFGIFPLTSPVIFIAPAPNKDLMKFHRRIHQALKKKVGGSWEMYKPGKWIPHLTIVRDIEEKDLPTALDICMKIQLPLELRITQLGVVSFEPVISLFKMNIGTR